MEINTLKCFGTYVPPIRFGPWPKDGNGKVNPSTPRPEGQGLLRVDPEPRFLTPSLKTGLGAAERGKLAIQIIAIADQKCGVGKNSLYHKHRSGA